MYIDSKDRNALVEANEKAKTGKILHVIAPLIGAASHMEALVKRDT